MEIGDLSFSQRALHYFPSMQSFKPFSGITNSTSTETKNIQRTKYDSIQYVQEDKNGMVISDTKSSTLGSIKQDDTLVNETETENVDEDEDNVFKLLTFNTWGLKYVSKFRKERLVAIADRLAKSIEGIRDYDVIALQEIWTTEDWNYIDRVCSIKYPYRRWFSSGILAGPGLAVLSKYPIKKTFLYRFPISGRPSAFFRGDWYVGKSVAVTILVFKDNSTIALLNSHMHAPYAISGDAAYETHRACQAWEIATIVEELKEAGYAVILVGDLNSRPGSLQYNILEKEAGLKDSWESLNGKTDLELIKKMDPWEQIIKGATTCDSLLNTWRSDRRLDEACRLDYALIDNNMLQPIKASVDFTEKIPNVGSYSDHFAYSATFKLNKHNNKKHEGIEVSKAKELIQIYTDLRNLVIDYIETTLQWQRKWRMWHFIGSFAVSIAILPIITVVSYRAPWSSILFYAFGCIIFASGIINGMISFLFGRYELRNLREVVFEVDDRIKYLRTSL
jgi:sphingomyelin phosphodiesterase 2